uniref:3-hydroxyacyl-CoA dehydrogenase NAD-binding domain-containing protein n=1 Tax=Roseovarius indicus TaxID=540747 RepID=UPI003B52F9E7
MGEFITSEPWSKDPRILLMHFNNPPVNAFSIGAPKEMLETIRQAEADPAIGAVLLVPGGKGIMGGADIRVQGIAWPKGQPILNDLIEAVDTEIEKPVAILHRNVALGGAIELSLACRYRFAIPGTKVGQPEAKIGIPPGAGGTQRLTRLIGADRALPIIVSGDPIRVEEAIEYGWIDAIFDDATAVDEAAAVIVKDLDAGVARPRVREMQAKVENPEIFAEARDRAAKRARHQLAPVACIDCVEAATTMPFHVGMAYERKRYLECVTSDQAKSLRHSFFAEREARKIPGISRDIEKRQIAQGAVIGAGTMGAGIAMCFANAGIPVLLFEREEAALERGLARIKSLYEGMAKKGRISAEAAAERTGLISGTLAMEDLGTADIVVEAAFEDIDVKKQIFGTLGSVAKPGAILATNTSYLDVNEIAAATQGREADVLGMHFFSPAHIMKLLEVVRADKTAPEVLATALELGTKLGKTAVVAGVCHGFIGNRMFAKYNRESEFLLQEGATVEQVDNALTNFGMAMGPFTVRDMAGLDISWAMRKSTAHLRDPNERYSKVGDLVCEEGWYGQKTGKGFYVYEDGKRLPNPDLEAIIDASAKEAGITRGTVTDEMIIERCIYALINEAAKILDEGVALRSSDIDLTYMNGYGFPRWRGGPLFWADTIGPRRVLGGINYFNTIHDFWEPAPLLVRMAAEGGTFAEWDKENAQ